MTPGAGATDEAYNDKARELLPKLSLLKEWSSRQRLEEGARNRAFIIEFAGMPKAGKSTLIENLRHYFSHGWKVFVKTTGIGEPTGYQVHTPAEGVSLRTPTYLKSNRVDFNLWAGAYAVQELLQARHDNYHDLVILDRGPWDAGCWLSYFKEKAPDQFQDPDDADKLVDFFQLNHWMTQADLHVVLVVDPVQAADREKRQRLIEHPGPASDSVLMEAMRRIYEGRFTPLQEAKAAACEHVGQDAAILIDSTGKLQKELALEVIQATFRVLEAKLRQPCAAPYSSNEFEAQFAGLLVEMPPEGRSTLLEAFPNLVEKVNALPSAQRSSFRSKVRDGFYSRAGYDFMRTAPADLVTKLEGLVEEVKAERA